MMVNSCLLLSLVAVEDPEVVLSLSRCLSQNNGGCWIYENQGASSECIEHMYSKISEGNM